MFQPATFAEERPEVMHALMRAHPLATVVTDAAPLVADHLPMVVHQGEGGLTLRTHMHAANPLPRSGVEAVDALCVFQGPQSYISPSWYASKREHGRAVPTWNYAVVHARGTLRFVRGDADWLLDHLRALSAQHESHRSEPWQVSDAPADYVERLLRGIVGVEVAVSRLQGVWKMSQNKSAADRAGVREGLRAETHSDAGAVSALVPHT